MQPELKMTDSQRARLAAMHYTTDECTQIERTGTFLIPILKQMCADMVARAKSERDDATATFARDWTLQQMALDALPDGAAPMAKVELELKQRELVAAFVAAQKV